MMIPPNEGLGVKTLILELEKKEMTYISGLFAGWEETMVWSCLQGYMGRAFVLTKDSPESAQIVIGDFCFLAGTPEAELIKHIPGDYPGKALLLVPQNKGWNAHIEELWGERARKSCRYAIKKEKDVFDTAKLHKFTEEVPPEYELKQIDSMLYEKVLKEDWCRDLCSGFKSGEDFERRGVGFVIVKNGEIVAGASSYSVYDEGIEIEIDTKKEYRGLGFAKACGARLILECLKTGKYPSWDAIDMRSVSLAEKLGYHMDKPYDTYVIDI